MKNNINFKKKSRSRIILSKGHAAPALYSIYDHLGLLKNELNTLRKFKSRLQGHPDKKIKYSRFWNWSIRSRFISCNWVFFSF